MIFTIPTPLKLEHDELHADLVKATQAGGRVGDAAKMVARVLHEHFVKEEESAFAATRITLRTGSGSSRRSYEDRSTYD